MKQIKFLLSLAIALMIVMPVLAQDAPAAEKAKFSGGAEVSYDWANRTSTDNETSGDDDYDTDTMHGINSDGVKAVVTFGWNRSAYTSNFVTTVDADGVQVGWDGTISSGNLTGAIGFDYGAQTVYAVETDGVNEGNDTFDITSTQMSDSDYDSTSDPEDATNRPFLGEMALDTFWLCYDFGFVKLKTNFTEDIVRYKDMDDRFNSSGDLGIELSTSAEAGLGFFASVSNFGLDSYEAGDIENVEDDTNPAEDTDGDDIDLDDESNDYDGFVENRVLPVMGAGVTFVIQGNVEGTTINTTDVTLGFLIDKPILKDKDDSIKQSYNDDTVGEGDYMGYMVYLNATQLLPVMAGMSVDLDVQYAVNMFPYLDTDVNDDINYSSAYGGLEDQGQDSILGATLSVGVKPVKEAKVGIGAALLMGERGVGLDGDTKSFSNGDIANIVAGNPNPEVWVNGVAFAWKIGGLLEYTYAEKTTVSVASYHQVEKLTWTATKFDETAYSIEEGTETVATVTTTDVQFNVAHKFDDNFALGLDYELKMKNDLSENDGETVSDVDTTETYVKVKANYTF